MIWPLATGDTNEIDGNTREASSGGSSPCETSLVLPVPAGKAGSLTSIVDLTSNSNYTDSTYTDYIAIERIYYK